MIGLRPQRSDKNPARGMRMPAGMEKKVTMSPTWNWLRAMAFFIWGRTGISMEFPKTMTKGTPHKTANCSAVFFFKAFRLSFRLALLLV